MKRFLVALGLVLAILSASPEAGAERPPGANRAVREGFWAGVSLGVGAIWADTLCTQCQRMDGLALDIRLGAMVAAEAALLLDLSSLTYKATDADLRLGQTVAALAFQQWVSKAVWFKGGLGYGYLVYENPADAVPADTTADTTGDEKRIPLERPRVPSHHGVAATGAIGVELLERSRYVLDVQLRGASVHYEGHNAFNYGSVLLGVTWY